MNKIFSVLLFCAAMLGGEASANEPVIKICVNSSNSNVPCTAAQRHSVARTAGMTAVSDYLDMSGSSVDVYVFNYADGNVSAYMVSSRIEMVRGEDRIVTSVAALNPDAGIVANLQSAHRYMKDAVSNGISSSTLAWDYQNERPVSSAHQLVDQSFANQLQQALSRTLSNNTDLTTRTGIEVIKNWAGLDWTKGITISFPDGTVVQVKLVGIIDDNDAGISFEIEIIPGTAMDGNVRIPSTRAGFGGIFIENMQGDQLGRFLDTARMMGIPITGGGGGGMSCSWDGQTITCRVMPR